MEQDINLYITLEVGDHRHWHGGYVNKNATSFPLPGHRPGILDFTVGAKHLKIHIE